MSPLSIQVFLGDISACLLEIMKIAYSGEVGHAFQWKSAGHSGGSRPPVPVIPATPVGA